MNSEKNMHNDDQNPAQTNVPGKKFVTLSDGRIAEVREGTGRDLINAMRISSDQEERGMILAATVTKIDGKPLFYEDYLDLKLQDCTAILTAANSFSGNDLSQEPTS